MTQFYNYHKSLKELNMMDSFLFDASTQNPHNAEIIAKIIIERATGRKINHIVIESQKQIKGITPAQRGIRMDLYITETDNNQNRIR